jgi:purine-binding chemotaxis protein CheW
MDQLNISEAAGMAHSGEFLTFTLGREEYGMDILKVQEIRGYDAVTHIANTPEYIKGVINLRGIIVPIIDLRLKLHLEDAQYNQFTVVIILNVGAHTVGVVVDSVSDVIALTAEQIRPAPEFGAGIDTRYVTGLGAIDSRMLILLDVQMLISVGEVAALAGTEQAIAA